jgi:hypothetical protein
MHRPEEHDVRPRILNMASTVLALLSAMLGAFCWWGLFTEAGSRHFDEMAGLVPFYAGIAGALSLVLSMLLMLWRRSLGRRGHRQQAPGR